MSPSICAFCTKRHEIAMKTRVSCTRGAIIAALCGVRDVLVNAVIRRPYGSSKNSSRNKYRTCEETTPQDKKAEYNDAVSVINGAQAEKEK